MSTRHVLRMTAAAAATALAAIGVHAVEATQWDPQAEARQSATGDAMLNPTAWTVQQQGEATVFHDAVARDSMTSRAEVRHKLREWQARGLVDDTGEAGATDRVLNQRHAFVESERARLMAMNTPAESSIDPIAELAVQTALVDARGGTPSFELASEDTSLRLPGNQSAQGAFPTTEELVMTMGPDGQWRDEHIVAEGPSYVETTAGTTVAPVTVAVR
ncbi:hypothetical protein [Piscinibacter sp. XHJ-5]|uniref:hypothetical protein n=1 Tax=Piscinibacter sp. XHJ-5 TaxID=3037797 RepID=UPI002452DF65|nr:hypothetical protein [Piscinibacter sp. XHJ-5]